MEAKKAPQNPGPLNLQQGSPQPSEASHEIKNEKVVLDLKKLSVFRRQVSGTRFMFQDAEGNICKMSNDKEIGFYKMCPKILQKFVPLYIAEFKLREGIDKLQLDEPSESSEPDSTDSVLGEEDEKAIE